MSWIEILLIVVFSGAFGGILDVLRLIDIRKLIEEKEISFVSRWRFFYALTLGGVIGSGGGFAMLVLLTSTSKLQTINTPENILFLIGLGVVSGFLGYSLLLGMAQRVKDQVDKQIDDRVEASEQKTNRKIEVTEERITRNVNEFATAIQKAFAAANALDQLNSNETAFPPDEKTKIQMDAKVALTDIENARLSMPDDRTIGIMTARLYKGLKDLSRAIEVLTQVLNKRIKANLNNNDTAALLYNRACYYCLSAAKLDDTDPQKIELKEKAYTDLEKSLSIDDCRAYAATDDDLKLIWEEPRFKKLLE